MQSSEPLRKVISGNRPCAPPGLVSLTFSGVARWSLHVGGAPWQHLLGTHGAGRQGTHQGNELRLSHLKKLILHQGNRISNHSKVYFKDSCTLATTWHWVSWVRHAVGGRSSWVLSLLNPFAAASKTQHSGIQRCNQRMWDLRPVVAGHALVWGREIKIVARKAVVKMWYTHGIPMVYPWIPAQFMEFVLREIMIDHHKPPNLQLSYFQTPSCLTKSLKTMKMFCLDTKSPRIPSVQQVPSTLIKSFHDGLLWHILGKPGGSGRSSNKVVMKLSNPAISCNILYHLVI